jgi:hypothetical protein
VGDTGGAIKGRRIDLCYDEDNLILWKKWVDVYLLARLRDQIHYVLPDWPLGITPGHSHPEGGSVRPESLGRLLADPFSSQGAKPAAFRAMISLRSAAQSNLTTLLPARAVSCVELDRRMVVHLQSVLRAPPI